MEAVEAVKTAPQQAHDAQKAVLQAVEVTATVTDSRHLQLDTPLPGALQGRVRVIVLTQPAPQAAVEYDMSELTEEEWLRAASVLQAQDFEDAPPGDIYTIKDGRPFREQE